MPDLRGGATCGPQRPAQVRCLSRAGRRVLCRVRSCKHPTAHGGDQRVPECRRASSLRTIETRRSDLAASIDAQCPAPHRHAKASRPGRAMQRSTPGARAAACRSVRASRSGPSERSASSALSNADADAGAGIAGVAAGDGGAGERLDQQRVISGNAQVRSIRPGGVRAFRVSCDADRDRNNHALSASGIACISNAARRMPFRSASRWMKP